MKLLDVVREVRRHLEENGRVSLRMLRRQYELDVEVFEVAHLDDALARLEALRLQSLDTTLA